MLTLSEKLKAKNEKLQLKIKNLKKFTPLRNEVSSAGLMKLKANEANLILQVHDELVLEVAEDKIKETAKIVKDVMENIVKLKVPLIVDLQAGRNWKEMEEIEI